MEVMELTFRSGYPPEGVVYPVDTPRDEMNMLVSPYIRITFMKWVMFSKKIALL